MFESNDGIFSIARLLYTDKLKIVPKFNFPVPVPVPVVRSDNAAAGIPSSLVHQTVVHLFPGNISFWANHRLSI